MEIDNTFPAYCSHILSYQPMYIYSLHTALNTLKTYWNIFNGFILQVCIHVHGYVKSFFFLKLFSNKHVI